MKPGSLRVTDCSFIPSLLLQFGNLRDPILGVATARRLTEIRKQKEREKEKGLGRAQRERENERENEKKKKKKEKKKVWAYSTESRRRKKTRRSNQGGRDTLRARHCE